MKLRKQFAFYVLQNIIGNIGMTAYFLADTFFISERCGSDGVAALGIVLPLYGLIFALGTLVSMGFATRFSIDQNGDKRSYYFGTAVITSLLLSVVFILSGIFIPDVLLRWMGGDDTIVAVGLSYTRIFLLFSPFFMLSSLFSAFVRNDNDPTLAMTATFVSSIFNIFGDYVLMYPMGLGLTGAALATAVSPIVGIGINLLHFRRKNNQLSFKPAQFPLSFWKSVFTLGTPSFISEIAGSVATYVLNILLLIYAGNVGVAAYGIVANISYVAYGVFNGICYGAQPLMSKAYGLKEYDDMKELKKLSLVTSFFSALILIGIALMYHREIILLFNTEGSAALQMIGEQAVKIYFYGFVFASLNISLSGYYSAVERSGIAFTSTVLRGMVMIVFWAFALSYLYELQGIWWSFFAAEVSTFVIISLIARRIQV